MLLHFSTNGFTSEDDSRGGHGQVCCLLDNGDRCQNPAGNASYSKRIQKTVQQRKLQLLRDDSVGIRFTCLYWQMCFEVSCDLPFLTKMYTLVCLNCYVCVELSALTNKSVQKCLLLVVTDKYVNRKLEKLWFFKQFPQISGINKLW